LKRTVQEDISITVSVFLIHHRIQYASAVIKHQEYAIVNYNAVFVVF